MTLERVVAGAAGLTCCAAVAWLVLSDHPVADPGPGTTSAAAVVHLRADVAAIGPFEQFNVNDENPFIPVHLRTAEKQAITEKPTKVGPKPPPEVIVEKPKPLPRLTGWSGASPACLGVVTAGGSERIVLRFPGENADRTLAIGESANRWTLTGIEHGQVALMRDPGGTVQRLVIGR
jgi:hypothetical protein